MEMDLQDKARMLDTYRDIELIIDKIEELSVGLPLVWVWTWDVVKSTWTDFMEGGDPEFCTTMDLDEVWEMFWAQADVNNFSLEYGSDDLYEAVRDWLIDVGAVGETIDEDERVF